MIRWYRIYQKEDSILTEHLIDGDEACPECGGETYSVPAVIFEKGKPKTDERSVVCKAKKQCRVLGVRAAIVQVEDEAF